MRKMGIFSPIFSYCIEIKTIKLLFIFKMWSYRIVFDVVKNVCELFDDPMFNNLVISNLTFYSCIYSC